MENELLKTVFFLAGWLTIALGGCWSVKLARSRDGIESWLLGIYMALLGIACLICSR